MMVCYVITSTLVTSIFACADELVCLVIFSSDSFPPKSPCWSPHLLTFSCLTLACFPGHWPKRETTVTSSLMHKQQGFWYSSSHECHLNWPRMIVMWSAAYFPGLQRWDIYLFCWHHQSTRAPCQPSWSSSLGQGELAFAGMSIPCTRRCSRGVTKVGTGSSSFAALILLPLWRTSRSSSGAHRRQCLWR